jgi:hypothetical protein
MDLFNFGWFRSHSGIILPWKFDADALSDGSIEAISKIICRKFAFSEVIGVPRGGLRLADALRPHAEPGYPLMIVDDVLTTGRSMEEYRRDSEIAIGVVILARGECPSWIWPIMRVSEWAQSRGTGLG